MRALQVLLFAVLIVTAGCASNPVRERGWLGGEYESYRPQVTVGGFQFPSDCPGEKDIARGTLPCGVVAKAVYPGSPADLAGIKVGDLIYKVAGIPVEGTEQLFTEIRSAGPGEKLPLTIRRQSSDIEVAVTVGVERYQRWKRFEIGLLPNPKLDLVPTPDYNWFGLSYLQHDRSVPELYSPVERLRASDSNYGKAKGNSWIFFLYPIGFGAIDIILEQKPYDAEVSLSEELVGG